MQIATLSLFRFDGVGAKSWAFTQMLASRRAFNAAPGVEFVKMVGTGAREGFHLSPNFGVWGVLAIWPDSDTAERGLDLPVYRRYRARAVEAMTLHLSPTRAKGRWSGVEPFRPERGTEPEPVVAALTRATIKPRHALKFWGRTPAIRAEIPDQPHLLFKTGMAEAPGFQQITFSIWDDAEAMRAFAYRRGGPHATAVEAVRREGWFSEELYARFRVARIDGAWSDAPRMAALADSAQAA